MQRNHHMTTQNVFATLIALCVLLFIAESARAQQPTPCGGRGGTGTVAVAGGGVATVTRTDAEAATPPTFVDPATGAWTLCADPVPTPPKPADCPKQGLASGWAPIGSSRWMCSSPVGHLDPGMLGDRQVVRDITGGWQGTRVYRCERRADGSAGWVSKGTSCGAVRRPSP